MEMSKEINEIAKALAAFQKVVPVIEKGKTAVGKFTYKYADIADVLKVIRGPLADQGLAISQFPENHYEVVDRIMYEYITITTILMHDGGQWLKSSLKGSVNANQAKMSNMQTIGSITTYLRRYSLASMLGLATDEDIDGNLSDNNQSNVSVEIDQTRARASGYLVHIQHQNVKNWCYDYLQNNRSLECAKKIEIIASDEYWCESQIIEMEGMARKVDEVDPNAYIKILESIAKLQTKRANNVENNKNRGYVTDLHKKITEKLKSISEAEKDL